MPTQVAEKQCQSPFLWVTAECEEILATRNARVCPRAHAPLWGDRGHWHPSPFRDGTDRPRHGQSPRGLSDRFGSEMVSVYYEIDGERYPRVTAICAIVANMGLAYWRGRVGNVEADRVSREATNLGTRAHKAVEQYIKRHTESCLDTPCNQHPCGVWWSAMRSDIQPLVMAYVEWHEEHIRAVIACEKLTVSRLHKFAGTVDLVAVLDNDPWPTVIDVKTSNSVGESWGLQTAAYQLALDEEGIECGRRVIIQLPSKEPGVCNQHDLDDDDKDQRAFINALKLYRWKASLKPPETKGPKIRFGGRP